MNGPRWKEATPKAITRWRREFEAMGPRHVNVCRWTMDYGWNISPVALEDYLREENEAFLKANLH